MEAPNHDKADTIGYHTPERHSMEYDEEIETSVNDTFPTHIHKRPELNPFIVNPQGTKRDHDIDLMQIR